MDPIARWVKSPSSNVEQYTIAWTYNGGAAGTSTVPQSAAGDASGYSSDWATSNPTITPTAGDVLSCSIVAVDTVNHLTSTPLNLGPLTIPATAPAPPASGTLTLS